MKLYDLDTAELALDAKKGKSGVTLSSTPFGEAGERLFYLRDELPWKGMTIGENESFEDYLSRLRDNGHSGLADGLENAHEVSMAFKDTYGTAIVKMSNGDLYEMPLKSARQMQAQKKDVEIIETSESSKIEYEPGTSQGDLMVEVQSDAVEGEPATA